ncbi:hypothetical protein [Amycolatopsis regifaucium]|uniref:Uncharacterized protein n=1 Tax=Amycolatopsis regifaucium TaxID=546365 RepID=A0A154M770_9PSEU|nr:hypothetical protein [Amycolatopsis regifaucium]KZB80386.1 hypothetical protein AVL48_12860 [Amycolatopsis regifaucium]OKA05355.1 hypothetical protein ATP06_0226685 [Amycolatopsis regifaucium]SFJ07195.1 hypothetical protein SAMN04489731_115108 [Amycolatopsis regifaucium]
MVEDLAFGAALACFAAVCVAVAPVPQAPAVSPFEFYRAVDRVCVRVWEDSAAAIRRYWPDREGDVATEQRKWQHYVATKVDDAKDVLKGATGVRTVPGGAASAREEFLAAVHHYVEAAERFQRNGAGSAVLLGASDLKLTAVTELAVRHGARNCERVI